MQLLPFGEWMTLCLMAIALGMDAFSVAIGVGMRIIRLRHIFKISMVIAVFHMVLPLLGMIIGSYLTGFIGHVAVDIGGIILIVFGFHMLFSSLFGEETSRTWFHPAGWGFFLFALGVSVDSFSVGLSLGLFAVSTWISIFLFGVAALMLTASGLLLGRKMGWWIGSYSEAIGGMILLVFGIKFLL